MNAEDRNGEETDSRWPSALVAKELEVQADARLTEILNVVQIERVCILPSGQITYFAACIFQMRCGEAGAL
jgi:hypothetical protein